MTDKELINCAEGCVGGIPPCSIGCPFDDGSPETSECMNALITRLLDLINRQQAEIDILKADLKRVCAERDARTFTNNFIKSEAIKEFARRLKCVVPQETGVIRCSDIDNIVKEMVGDTE